MLLNGMRYEGDFVNDKYKEGSGRVYSAKASWDETPDEIGGVTSNGAPTSSAVTSDPNPQTYWYYCDLVFDEWGTLQDSFAREPGYGQGDQEYTPVFSVPLNVKEFGLGPGSKSEAYANNLIKWTKNQHPLAFKMRASCWSGTVNGTDSTKEEAEAARERSIAIYRQGHPRRDMVHFVDYIPRA
jgi:hypothetical protein